MLHLLYRMAHTVIDYTGNATTDNIQSHIFHAFHRSQTHCGRLCDIAQREMIVGMLVQDLMCGGCASGAAVSY
jgi:hypothetical protein